MDRLNEYATIQGERRNMDHINDLYKDLLENALSLDVITRNIKEIEAAGADPDTLEDMYKNEFMLYMNNVSIYDDLVNKVDATEKTPDNQFALAKLKREAASLLRVGVVEVE